MVTAQTHLVATSHRTPLRQTDDDETVQQVVWAKTGSRQAEEVLFRKHAPMVYRVVACLLREQRDTEDLVHDTFIEAFRQIQRLRDPESFVPWLRSIAVAKVRQHCRRQKWHRLLGLIPKEAEVASEHPGVSRFRGETRAEVSKVFSVLDGLAANVKHAWLLRYVEEYDLAEISETLNCSLASTKRYIQKAEVALSEVWNEELP